MKKIMGFLTFGGLVLLFVTCGGGKAPGPAGLGGGSASNEDPAKHFKLTSQTVVIHSGSQAVKRISSDHSTFTLDGSADEVTRLAPGQVMLIPGVDVGKVVSVNRSGNDVNVTLGPVKITDVIHDGVLEWGPQKIDLDQGSWIIQGSAGGSHAWLLPTPPRLDPMGFFVPPAFADGGEKIELAVDDYKVSLSYSKDTWTLTAKKKVAGVEISVAVKVTLEKLETKGHIDVGYGTVSGYSLDAPVTGYIQLEVTSKTTEAGFFPQQTVIELPFEKVFPISIYGLPCYIGVKLNFLVQPSLATKNSGISVRLRTDFDGNPCFKYVNGELERCTEIKWDKPADPLSEVTATPSPGSIAMVFAVQCPKISFGLGTQTILRQGVFVDLVTSLGVNIFGATSILPCRQFTRVTTAGAGLEFELGPDLFKKLLQKLSSKVKLKTESKIELAREDEYWYSPHVNGCE